MKWKLFHRRGRHTAPSDILLPPDDSSVHKKTCAHHDNREKIITTNNNNDDDKGHPQHLASDDRTEVSQMSCSGGGSVTSRSSAGGLESFSPPSSPNAVAKAEDIPALPAYHYAIPKVTVPSALATSPRTRWRGKTTISSNAAKVVHFCNVELRYYQRIVGDHPDVEIPLGIGWKYNIQPIMTVDAFEAAKEQLRHVLSFEEAKEQLRQLAASSLETSSAAPPQPFKTTHAIVEPLKPSSLSNLDNIIHNNKSSNTNKLHRGTAFSEHSAVRASKPATSTTSTLTEPSKYLEPVTLKERVFLLKHRGGYTLQEIHRADRRRRVQMVLEWAYR